MTDTHQIIWEPDGLSLSAATGTRISDVWKDAATRPFPVPCAGDGLCGKCVVQVSPAENLSPLTEAEADILSPDQVVRGYRLACQAEIRGPVRLNLPAEPAALSWPEARGTDQQYPTDSLIERLILPKTELPAPRQGHSSNVVAWVTHRVREATGREIDFKSPHGLRQLSLPQVYCGELTLVNHQHKGVRAALPGNRPRSLGLCLDIGTITLAAYLCDLQTGQVLSHAASANPQRRFGPDLAARIRFAQETSDGLDRLRRIGVEAVNHLINRCLARAEAMACDVDDVAVLGNACMEQIFAGFHPQGLHLIPYLPAFQVPPFLEAGDLGLRLNPGTPVCLFPVVSGFVGGDALAAILAERPHHGDTEIWLLLDLGASSEVILGNRRRLWACSYATPALEGAGLSCGMRTVPGAIHRLDIEGGTVHWEVLGHGESPPLGICGPGVVDAVRALRTAGWLFADGALNPEAPGVVCDDRNAPCKAVLARADQTASGKEIAITVEDIDYIRETRGALAVCIEFLMRLAKTDRIDRTVITGPFGAEYDWCGPVSVGFLPSQVQNGQIRFAPHLAGKGGIMALLDRKRRAEVTELSWRVKSMELHQEPDFKQRFQALTTFPPLENTHCGSADTGEKS